MICLELIFLSLVLGDVGVSLTRKQALAPAIACRAQRRDRF